MQFMIRLSTDDIQPGEHMLKKLTYVVWLTGYFDNGNHIWSQLDNKSQFLILKYKTKFLLRDLDCLFIICSATVNRA